MKRFDEELDGFEKKLAQSMRRVNAPDTLAAFLLRAAEVQGEENVPWKQRKHRWSFAAPQWAAGAVAAVLLLSCFTVGGLQWEHKRVRAKADQDFETAQRIEQLTLEQARRQLQVAGVSLDQ